MFKKNNYFTTYFIFFCSFTFSLRGKEYFAKGPEPSRSEPGIFGPLEPEPEPLGKKLPGVGAGAAWGKNQEQEPEPLEKKVRSRSRSR